MLPSLHGDMHCGCFANKNKKCDEPQLTSATGLEPVHSESSRFLIYRLNHSAKPTSIIETETTKSIMLNRHLLDYLYFSILGFFSLARITMSGAAMYVRW